MFLLRIIATISGVFHKDNVIESYIRGQFFRFRNQIHKDCFLQVKLFPNIFYEATEEFIVNFSDFFVLVFICHEY